MSAGAELWAMGVKLGDIVPKREMELEELHGRRVAVDAYNTLYQFLSIIRGPGGTPLKDEEGRVTSHLSGLLYRTSSVVEKGILPCYVFDGEPPELKAETTRERRERREEAREEFEEAREAGEEERAYTKATQSASIDDWVLESSRELLDLLGLPAVQAPGEGEAQAAHMTRRGDAWAVASQDFDSLLFGADRLLRNLNVTGKRKLPGRDEYVEVRPELIPLAEALEETGLSREELVDVALLCGTDYNEGVKGVGPKTGLEIVREQGLENYLEEEGLEMRGLDALREAFLDPEVTEDYDLEWSGPDVEGAVEFLCGGHDFSEDRVRRALERLERGVELGGSQSRLGFF